MSEDKFSTVRLQNDLVEILDEIVKVEKDELGRLRFKSRADLVTQACEKFVKELRREAKR